MEVAGDLVTEKELHHAADFLTLTGVPGIASPIVSLFSRSVKGCVIQESSIRLLQ